MPPRKDTADMADTLTAGADAGNDTLAGGQGADSVTGAAGADLLNDTLAGGAGNDALLGAQGDDTVVTGSANDVVTVAEIVVVAPVADLEDAQGDPDAISVAPPRMHQALVEQFAMKWHEVKVFAEHLTGDLDGELGDVLALARKA